jgi:NAD(P)-dependent dehydrogenase (short-subunit alcohol dehydrogenase family)
MPLQGRSAIITGASQGLGRAIAEHFVRAGSSVLLVARDEALVEAARRELARLTDRPGQAVHAMGGDVADPASCAAIVARADDRFPDLTILVNNAGIYGPLGRFEEVAWDAWVEAIRVNLLGTALMCRAVIPGMRARGYGKIITLSGGGATAPLPRISAYAASKAAVVRLTETLAVELREAHVDVNAIAPGALNTRLLDQVLAAGPDAVGERFYERSAQQQREGGTPLAKGAALAVFLASAGSDGITGRLLSAVWDDWHRLPERGAELAASDVYTLRRITPEDRSLAW